MISLLFGSLLVSIALNLVLWKKLSEHTPHTTLPPLVYEDTPALSNKPDTAPSVESKKEHHATDVPRLVKDQPANIDRLYQLLQDEDWPQLTVAVREVLKQYPDNIEAHLIEAELIARTEPLAIALVHYYSLFDLALSSEQVRRLTEKIEQLFDIAESEIEQIKMKLGTYI